MREMTREAALLNATLPNQEIPDGLPNVRNKQDSNYNLA